ncbi:MAG: FAD-dependent oxidoreductase [Chloroflexi bacterium]|nr:FAD-dependent oxidoreductase [Chloroflexota bacterium]
MPRIKVFSAVWCPYCKRLKKFLGEQRLPYENVDIDEDADGRKKLEELQNGGRTIPTVLFEDGSFSINPSPQELMDKLGMTTRAGGDFYDTIVVGGGPAGLTAAIYLAREDISTLVIDRGALGGQAAITENLDNVPGFPEGIGGSSLADRLAKQASRFGAETLVAQEVTAVAFRDGFKLITTASGDSYCANALVLTPGSTYRRLNIPGEDSFIGAGIHFCATCDGPYYVGKEILVIGGGNSGVQEGIFLTKFGSKVTIVDHLDKLRASPVLTDRAYADPKIEVLTNTTVDAFEGDDRLRTVVLRDVKTGETRRVHPAGAFIFIGLDPNTAFLKGFVDLDDWGYIKSEPDLATNVPGVYAAGDARLGSTKQVASATGEGATAALMVRHYLERTKQATGIDPAKAITAVG